MAHACAANVQVEVYDQTPDFLRGLEMDQDALTKAIIGTIGDVDAYQLPDAKGHTAFMRYILGITDAERQQRREEILGTSTKDFKCGPPPPFHSTPLMCLRSLLGVEALSDNPPPRLWRRVFLHFRSCDLKTSFAVACFQAAHRYVLSDLLQRAMGCPHLVVAWQL